MMDRPWPRIRSYVVQVFFGALGAMVLIKLIGRPWVISRDTPPVFDIVVLSFPSFVESIVVLILVFGLVSIARVYAVPFVQRLSSHLLLALSVVFVGTYVLTQELSPQNLGGVNVVDPWDVLASLVGLALMALLFVRHGILEEGD